MKISQEKFERLLRFLDAEMDPQEITAFEQEINSDPDLKEQLDLQLRLSRAFSEKTPGAFSSEKIHIDESLRSILHTAKDKFLEASDAALSPEIHILPGGLLKNSNKHVVSINSSRWLAAASVIGLALFSSLVYYSGKKNDGINLVINNPDTVKKSPMLVNNDIDTTQKQPDLPVKKMAYASLADNSYVKDKGPANPPQLLAQEISDYDAGDYKTIQAFDADNIPKTRGITDEMAIKALAHYYKGLSFIETKDNEAARTNLQWVIDSSTDKLLQIKAAWYQAIVCIKTGDIQKAEGILNRLASNRTEQVYRQKASALLNKINEGK